MTRALLVMLAWVRMLMLVRGKWTLSLSQHLRTKRVAALRQACLPYARSHGFYSSQSFSCNDCGLKEFAITTSIKSPSERIRSLVYVVLIRATTGLNKGANRSDDFLQCEA